MTNEEGMFWLSDRIDKIKQVNELYNLEENCYLSFSGGKDSTKSNDKRMDGLVY